jgi:hypothetical protein
MPARKGDAMFQNLHPKCSNPSCAESFEWLAGGKLFRFRRESVAKQSPDAPSPLMDYSHHVEHFWLCEKCSQIFTLEYKQGEGVLIRLLWPSLPAAENDMHLLGS